jgi:hypothetical protein
MQRRAQPRRLNPGFHRPGGGCRQLLAMVAEFESGRMRLRIWEGMKAEAKGGLG